MIEWFARTDARPRRYVLVDPPASPADNDRRQRRVAAAELARCAGRAADLRRRRHRCVGTESLGQNVDVRNLGELNLFSTGVLIPAIAVETDYPTILSCRTVESTSTATRSGPTAPTLMAGEELVYTRVSGLASGTPSRRAIRRRCASANGRSLGGSRISPFDPQDLGRSYESRDDPGWSTARSGKGGRLPISSRPSTVSILPAPGPRQSKIRNSAASSANMTDGQPGKGKQHRGFLASFVGRRFWVALSGDLISPDGDASLSSAISPRCPDGRGRCYQRNDPRGPSGLARGGAFFYRGEPGKRAPSDGPSSTR